VKSDDIRNKIRKNIIVHHYEYNSFSPVLESQIKEAEERLHELKKQRKANITIFLPSTHTIFSTGLQLLNRDHEWATHIVTSTGEEKQRRELVYIEKITPNADLTAQLDERERYAMNCDNEAYTTLEGFFYGKKSILKLSGLDVKDLK